MAESDNSIHLEITVDDKGSPVVESFARHAGPELKAQLQQAHEAIERLEKQLTDLRSVGLDSGASFEHFSRQLEDARQEVIRTSSALEDLSREGFQVANTYDNSRDSLEALRAKFNQANADVSQFRVGMIDATGGVRDLTPSVALSTRALEEMQRAVISLPPGVAQFTDGLQNTRIALTASGSAMGEFRAHVERGREELKTMDTALGTTGGGVKEMGTAATLAAGHLGEFRQQAERAREESRLMSTVIEGLGRNVTEVAPMADALRQSTGFMAQTFQQAGRSIHDVGDAFDVVMGNIRGSTELDRMRNDMANVDIAGTRLEEQLNELAASMGHTRTQAEQAQTGFRGLDVEAERIYRSMQDVVDVEATLVRETMSIEDRVRALAAEWRRTSPAVDETTRAFTRAGIDAPQSLEKITQATIAFTTRAAQAGDDVRKLQSAFNAGEATFEKFKVDLDGSGRILNEFGQVASGPVTSALNRLRTELLEVQQRIAMLGTTTPVNVEKMNISFSQLSQRIQAAGQSVPRLQSVVNAADVAIQRMGITTDSAGNAVNRFGVVITGPALKALNQFQFELEVTRIKLEQLKQAKDDATASGGMFGGMMDNLLGRAALVSAAYTAVHQAMELVRRGVVEAVKAFSEQEFALTSWRNMTGESIEAQNKLQARLSQLPPILGSLTELTNGYVDAFRATRDQETAIKVVTEAGKLHVVTLVDMKDATNILVDAMTNYNVKAKDLGRISDQLFAGFNNGAGTFEEYTKALSRVIPVGEELGIKFSDLAAILGQLAIKINTPQGAATALLALLKELTTHSSAFAARGIDLQGVLAGPDGLVKALSLVEPELRKNADAWKELFGSSRSYTAIIEMLGPGAEEIVKSQAKVAAAFGSVDKAVENNRTTLHTWWETAKNLTSNYLATVGEGAEMSVIAMWKLISTYEPHVAAIIKVLEAQERERKKQEELAASRTAGAKSLDDEVAAMANSMNASNANARARAALTAAVEAEKVAFKEAGRESKAYTENLEKLTKAGEGLFALDAGDMMRAINNAAGSLLKLSENSNVSLSAVQDQARKLADAIRGAFGEIPPHVQSILDTILAKSDSSSRGVAAAFRQAGLKMRDSLTEAADATFINFEKIVNSGQATEAQIKAQWERVKQAFIAAYGYLPEYIKEVDAHIRTQVQETAEGIAASFKFFGQKARDELVIVAQESLVHFNNIRNNGNYTAEQIAGMWAKVRAAYIAAFGALPEEIKKLDAEIQKSVQTTEEGVAQSFKRMGMKTAEETQNAAIAAINNFNNIRTSGEASGQQLMQEYMKLLKIISEAGFKQLPAGFYAAKSDMERIARELGITLPQIFRDMNGQVIVDGKSFMSEWGREISQRSTQTLQDTATNWARGVQQMIDSGQVGMDQIVKYFLAGVTKIDEAGFRKLPPDIQALFNQIQRMADQMGITLPEPFLNAMGKIATGAQDTATKIGQSFHFAGVQSKSHIDNLYAEWKQTMQDVLSSSDVTAKGIADKFVQGVNFIVASGKKMPPEMNLVADQVIAAFHRLGVAIPPPVLAALEQIKQGINNMAAGAEQRLQLLRDQTQAMFDKLNYNVREITFGSDRATIEAQIRMYQVKLQQVIANAGSFGLGSDYIRSQSEQINKALAELYKRLADLNAQQQATLGTGGGSGSNITSGGGGGSNLTGGGSNVVTGGGGGGGTNTGGGGGGLTAGQAPWVQQTPLTQLYGGASYEAYNGPNYQILGTTSGRMVAVIGGTQYELVASGAGGYQTGIIFKVPDGATKPSNAQVYDYAARYYFIGNVGSASGTMPDGHVVNFPMGNPPPGFHWTENNTLAPGTADMQTANSTLRPGGSGYSYSSTHTSGGGQLLGGGGGTNTGTLTGGTGGITGGGTSIGIGIDRSGYVPGGGVVVPPGYGGVQLPTQQGMQQQTNHINIPVTIQVPQTTDRLAVQDLVNRMAPALNEAINRGIIRVGRT